MGGPLQGHWTGNRIRGNISKYHNLKKDMEYLYRDQIGEYERNEDSYGR